MAIGVACVPGAPICIDDFFQARVLEAVVHSSEAVTHLGEQQGSEMESLAMSFWQPQSDVLGIHIDLGCVWPEV